MTASLIESLSTFLAKLNIYKGVGINVAHFKAHFDAKQTFSIAFRR